MIEKFLTWLVLLFGSIFPSCFNHVNRKTDKLFECSFETEVDEKIYYLSVSKITEDDYNLAKGLNVVEDVVEKAEHNFYFVKFWTIDEEKNIEIQYNFENLHDKYPDTKKFPTNYVDDNGNSLFPAYSAKASANNSYLIVFNEIYYTFRGENFDA